jgi:hypothetical protein
MPARIPFGKVIHESALRIGANDSGKRGKNTIEFDHPSCQVIENTWAQNETNPFFGGNEPATNPSKP